MSPLLKSKPVQHPNAYVFCTSTCGIGLENGLTLHLQRGQVWDPEDDVVLEHQSLFSDTPLEVCRSTPPTTIGELRGTDL
jgi:hypothetical protein